MSTAETHTGVQSWPIYEGKKGKVIPITGPVWPREWVEV